MPNIQKTKSGKWKGIVEMGKDPVTGRRKRKTKTQPTKKEANAWIAEQVQKRDNGIVVDPKNYTLKEYLHRWLKDYAEPNLAATTYDGYEVIVRSHLIPALGQLKIDEIKPMHIHPILRKNVKMVERTANLGVYLKRHYSNTFEF